MSSENPAPVSLPEVLAIIEARGRVPKGILPSVVTYLRAMQSRASARAEAARENTRAHSERLRAGIKLAIGALAVPGGSLNHAVKITLDRIARAGPSKYGLPKIPSPGLVRAVVREMRAFAKNRDASVPERANHRDRLGIEVIQTSRGC